MEKRSKSKACFTLIRRATRGETRDKDQIKYRGPATTRRRTIRTGAIPTAIARVGDPIAMQSQYDAHCR